MGNKRFKLKKTNVFDYATFLFVIVVFVIVTALNSAGALNRSQQAGSFRLLLHELWQYRSTLTVGIWADFRSVMRAL